MNKIGKLSVIALVLILSIGFACPVFAASDIDSDTLIPVTKEAELSASFYNNQTPVTAEPVTSVSSSREPVVIEPPTPNPTPQTSESSDDGGILSGIADFFSGLLEDVKNIGKALINIPGNIINSFKNWVLDMTDMGAGREGLMNIIKDGGARYVSGTLNDLINVLYDVFYAPGIAIMMVCFCYSVFKGCYSMELGDSNSIIKPVIGMIITLFAFTMAKEIMTALFIVAMQLTDKIISAAQSVGLNTIVDRLMTDATAKLGYMFVTGILQMILMINIAKIALMQCTAPLYIGFAAAENSRRIMINLLKEYAKCCLVPPITAAYALITFCLCDSNWNVFASIVLGISIWSIASKHHDKIFS